MIDPTMLVPSLAIVSQLSGPILPICEVEVFSTDFTSHHYVMTEYEVEDWAFQFLSSPPYDVTHAVVICGDEE